MTTFTNSKLTDEYVSNATLIRLILWADQHNSHYVAAALRELQERRKADSVPVEINDDMAYAFHRALSDSSPGADEVEEIKTGLRAAFANITVQPVLIVPDEIEPDDSNTFDYVDGWNACRAAMLRGKADGKPELTVWYGAMPETNGKINWTAILHRKGQQIWEGITIDRSEYPDRVRYEADRMRHLIGELPDEPDILSYDADAHSGYVKPGNSPATSDGWVKCSDAVPAECCDVILHDSLGNVFPGSWDRIFCSVRGGNKMAFVDSNGTEVENAIHWMPLPAAPQQEVKSALEHGMQRYAGAMQRLAEGDK